MLTRCTFVTGVGDCWPMHSFHLLLTALLWRAQTPQVVRAAAREAAAVQWGRRGAGNPPALHRRHGDARHVFTGSRSTDLWVSSVRTVWRVVLAGHLPDLGGQVEGGQAGGGPRGARGGRVAGDPRWPHAAHSGQPRQTLPANGASECESPSEPEPHVQSPECCSPTPASCRTHSRLIRPFGELALLLPLALVSVSRFRTRA